MNGESKENTSSIKMSNTILITLLVVAIVLSYFLYQKITNTAVPSPQYTNTQNPPPAAETENTSADSFTFPPLSADERGALNMPKSASAPEADFLAHVAFVQKAAVASNTLALGTDCRVSPVVLKTRKGAKIEIKNYDGIPHTIPFDEKRSFAVPAQASITIPVDFGEIGGIYGYGCEKDSSAIGMLWLAQ